jgi:uncharacterized protein (DUF1778 family)
MSEGSNLEKGQLNIRLPKVNVRLMKLLAKHNGQTLSEYVDTLILRSVATNADELVAQSEQDLITAQQDHSELVTDLALIQNQAEASDSAIV